MINNRLSRECHYCDKHLISQVNSTTALLESLQVAPGQRAHVYSSAIVYEKGVIRCAQLTAFKPKTPSSWCASDLFRQLLGGLIDRVGEGGLIVSMCDDLEQSRHFLSNTAIAMEDMAQFERI